MTQSKERDMEMVAIILLTDRGLKVTIIVCSICSRNRKNIEHVARRNGR
jgi:hypothetical protein